MTSEDVRAELDRDPFLPFRLHLASGKTIDIDDVCNRGWMLQNAILIVGRGSIRDSDAAYRVLALRNIEMIERLSELNASAC